MSALSDLFLGGFRADFCRPLGTAPADARQQDHRLRQEKKCIAQTDTPHWPFATLDCLDESNRIREQA
jgi:hypothetical protein